MTTKIIDGKTYLVGKPLIFPKYQGKEYALAVQSLMDEMIRDCANELINQTRGIADSPFLERVQRLLNALLKKWENRFLADIPLLASKMLLGVDKASSIAVSASLKEISKDLLINPSFLMEGALRSLFEAEITKNVNLFKTIPTQFFSEVQDTVIKSIVQGRGMADLVPYFQTFTNSDYHPHTFHRNYAVNRALDQTRKAYQSANTMRVTKAGGTEFMWIHSGGSPDPDPTHVAMHRKIYSFDNPPVIMKVRGKEVKGLPAERPNCRCTFCVVFKIGDKYV